VPQATGQSGQSQVSFFRPITGQFILTNHRRYINPADQIKGDRMILQANAVSFYLVRWVGVSSVIGQNKLTCDWSK